MSIRRPNYEIRVNTSLRALVRLTRVWALLVFFAASFPAHAISESRLTELLETARVEMDMPGLRAAVRLEDGQIVRAATGLADQEANISLNDTIGMPGGSTGKTFVAALTMLLAEDGTLSLNDPVSKWLGDVDWYPRLPNADSMQVRHLLSHSAGIKDYIATAGFHSSMIWRVVRKGSAKYQPEELIEFVLDKRPLFAPGEGFHYTDAGYLVLGRVIEAATGRSYYELLEERILVPHGLVEIRPQNTSVLDDITPGYMGGSRNLKEDGRMKFDPSSEWTGGGLVTNPTMLAQFFGLLADGQIVSEDSLALMINSGWKNPETPGNHYGYGLFVSDSGKTFGHGGLWPGYRTHVKHFEPSGITVAVQTNRDGSLDLPGLINQIRTLAEPE